MKHFPIDRWTDFVRGTTPPEERAALRRHLDSGCARCAGTVAVLRQVVGEAARRAESAPPDFAVRSVKAFFALQPPQRESVVRRVLLYPVYDSAREPASVMVRGEEDRTRQLGLDSVEFHLELRLEQPAAGDAARLAGQFVRRGGEPVARSPAYLVVDGRVAASAFTDPMGWFSFELAAGSKHQVWLGPDPSQLVVADLPPPAI